jgi:two-component system response regulator GlrR
MSNSPIIGCSNAHREVLERIGKVALTDAEILISTPSGVGKELYARYPHECSPRGKAAFVPVNCGALPTDLHENELFGHLGGAFTGARPRSEGLVAAAESGTLFLDEIDSLSPICQVKLLRFLQEKEYRRLGKARLRRANVRIVAATNADLIGAVREGWFREDLFFRIRVFPVEVPPLCQGPCDIPLLIEEFANRFAKANQLPKIVFSPATMEKLNSYVWPGNIRELENCVNYLTCWQLNRLIQPSDLPLLNLVEIEYVNGQGDGKVDEAADGPEPNVNQNLVKLPYNDAKRGLLDHFERQYVEETLRRSGGNIAKAARESRKPRRVFFEMTRKHSIKAADYLPIKTNFIAPDRNRRTSATAS